MANELTAEEPKPGDRKFTLLRKIAAASAELADNLGGTPMQPTVDDGEYDLLFKIAQNMNEAADNASGGGGGGGGEADNDLAATTLAGLKAIDTDGVYSPGNYIFTKFSGEAVKMRVLTAGSTNSDPDQVRPNDYNAGTNNVFWQTEM